MKTFIQIFKDCKTYCPYKNYSKEDMKEELYRGVFLELCFQLCINPYNP
jgi:hypothetical protein